jgi:hypothetical protein
MKAIKIDVVKQQVYLVDIQPGIDDIYKQLECSVFTCIYPDTTPSDVLYLDDEGLLKSQPLGAFRIQGYNQALSGHGLLIGDDGHGDSEDVHLSVDQVKSLVSFVPTETLPEPNITVFSGW